MKDSQKTTQADKSSYPWYVGQVALNAISRCKGIPVSGPTSREEGPDRASAVVESTDVQRVKVIWEKNIAPFNAWQSERTNIESLLGKAEQNLKYQREHLERVNVEIRKPDGSSQVADPLLVKDVERYVKDAEVKAESARQKLKDHDAKMPKHESIQFYLDLDAEVAFL